MKVLTTLLFSFLIITPCAFASNYKLNESNINQLFEHSNDISMHMVNSDAMKAYFSSLPADENAKSQTTAAIIALAVTIGGGVATGVVYQIISIATGGVGALVCWPILFAPLIPFHRLYLGTDGNGFKVSALYCVTLTWCGWLNIIDGIMLLIDDSKSKYIGSSKYIMWVN
jgi:hypothetical protein